MTVKVNESTAVFVEEDVDVGKLVTDTDNEEFDETVCKLVVAALDENEADVVIDLTLLDDRRAEKVFGALKLFSALGLINEVTREDAVTFVLKDSIIESAALDDDEREGFDERE